jgi:archaeal flagellar protein FlaI
MVDDYLSELMKKAKETSVSSTPKTNKNDVNEEIIIKNKNFKKNVEDHDEEIASTIKQKDMEKFNKKIVEKETSDKPNLEINADDLKEKTLVEKKLETAKKKELAKYGKVTIYEIAGEPMKFYFIPTLRPTSAERKRNPDERRFLYKQKITDIITSNPNLKIPPSRLNFYADAVVREMVGYGLIDDLIKDDKLEEIMVVGPKKPVYVFHREFEMMQTSIEFFSEQEIEDLINKIAREVGRRVDVSNPLLDARLTDGSRVNATIPPASISGGTLTIRKFREDPYSIIDLIRKGTLSSEAAAFLWVCIDGMNVKPANMLISGGTGSGKTTLLNVLAAFISQRERVLTIEDTAELSLPLKHWIRMEARPPGLEGTGELRIDILTKNALRMRPDRIIVGEIRHDEAFTLFTAINTGHDGSLGTVHANSSQETLVRVTSPPMNVPKIMLSGLDLVIVEHRYHDRKKGTIRRVSEIAEVYGDMTEDVKTQAIFQRDPVKDVLERTLINSKYVKTLRDFTGLSKDKFDAELDIRKQFLEKLVEENIHDLKKVSELAQEFVEKRAYGENL